MRQLSIVGLCFLSLLSANAQTSKQSLDNSIEYFNNFQKYLYNTPNADSAFYFAKKLASNDKNIFFLRQLLHDSFAQGFILKNDTNINELDSISHRLLFSKGILINLVSDTLKSLSETARPLYIWTKIQDTEDNVSKLANLTNEFIKKELSSGDIYKNRAGRYGLLIYQIISKHTELKPLAENLFAMIYSNLKNNQVIATDSSSRADLKKRAWYRYLYAYTNYLKSQQTDNINRKEADLKTAFDHSPDLIDKNHQAGYFYDMIFLFGGEEKQTFKIDYITFLVNADKDKTNVLSLLLKTALIEPEFKNQLKEFYNKNINTTKSFNEYWISAIDSNAKIAQSISLYMLDKNLFSSKQLSGKWILVDFWGTWCMPCRQEHPEMQRFYDSIVVANPKIISLLTIACRDTEEKVLAYLNEKHFTFPVAMSDNKIQNIYSVQGYPTKILITPKGKYITVPFGTDWVNFVKEYCSLH